MTRHIQALNNLPFTAHSAEGGMGPKANLYTVVNLPIQVTFFHFTH